MRIKVKGNLNGAITAVKGQEITVTAEQGADLIQRGLADEVAVPVPAEAEKPKPKRTKKA